jgi:hypothetical protein
MLLPNTTANGLRAVNAGIVLASGANTLSTASPTEAAIYAEGTTIFTDSAATPTVLEFVRVESSNINASGTVLPDQRAITIADAVPTGTIRIADFSVIGGTQPIGEYIQNAGSAVIFNISGSVITPIP